MDKADGYAPKVLPVAALFTDAHRSPNVRLGRPSIVYFYTLKDDAALLAYEHQVFADERVGVGSRLFNCIRISLDDMASKADRDAYSKDGPSIHMFDADGKPITRYDGTKLTSHKLYQTMQAVVKEHYELDLLKFLLKEGEILTVLDRTWWDLKLLAEDLESTKKHLEKHNCAHGIKQLADIQADIVKAEKERDEALLREKKLFEPVEKATSP